MIYTLGVIVASCALICTVDLIVTILEKLEKPKAALIKIHNETRKDKAA